jgi:hypothetical protein
MKSWIEIQQEIKARGDNDIVRREYIRKVEEITGRPLIIYCLFAENFLKSRIS